MTLFEGTYNINYSFVGYGLERFEIELDQNKVHNVSMQSSIEMDEVEVIAEKLDANYNTTKMNSVKLDAQVIKSLPNVGGEPDVMKVLQLMPGVQSGSEASSGLYVRGGGPDQNLILLDGVPVYNASHLFGFMSVFNSDAIKSVELTKGGIPARYGGRLSSIVDIRMKEGNNKKFWRRIIGWSIGFKVAIRRSHKK